MTFLDDSIGSITSQSLNHKTIVPGQSAMGLTRSEDCINSGALLLWKDSLQTRGLVLTDYPETKSGCVHSDRGRASRLCLGLEHYFLLINAHKAT